MGFGIFGNKRRVKPLFVGSYGNDLTRGIYAFHIDIDNGEILKKKFYKSLANPSALFKRERFIYTCYQNNTGLATDGGLWQYAAMDLQFGLAARVSYHGRTYVSCFVNEDRSCAYAVDYYNGEVVVIPILKQKIVKVSQAIQHSGSSLDEKRQSQAHPTFIDETKDHQRIFVCDLGMDEVVLYRVVEKGKLEKDEENSFKVKAGNGPKKMIFNQSGTIAYLLNELSNTISVYHYEDCHFTHVQDIDTYPKDEYKGESVAGDIIMSDAGDYIFVTNRGHDSISAFKVEDDGRLSFVEFVDTDDNPVALTLINDRWLIVAAKKGGTLESFELKRGESKGCLFETHFTYMVGEPVCMVEGRGI